MWGGNKVPPVCSISIDKMPPVSSLSIVSSVSKFKTEVLGLCHNVWLPVLYVDIHSSF